jgi:hypothetical protein
MYQVTSVLSELEGSAPLSVRTRAYVGQRARNAFHDYVIRKFKESDMTKAELARRLQKGQDRINRLLNSPGNWTIDTVAELLAGISAEELLPNSATFLRRPPRNYNQTDNWELTKSPTPLPPPSGSTARVNFIEYAA